MRQILTTIRQFSLQSPLILTRPKLLAVNPKCVDESEQMNQEGSPQLQRGRSRTISIDTKDKNSHDIDSLKTPNDNQANQPR